ncbi:metallophosphoesterase family protein [Salipiger sp.]|uniref:metallophosphoesterase family protein n=1 Tax=Salipiger sp. TaxID=2078585 RepID=UPI003A978E9F
MTPIYAVGDIHGHVDQLHKVLKYIERDGGQDCPVVFVGDYVDRGPKSRAVIETLMQGQAEGKPWTCLMGNHDRYVLRFLEDPDYIDSAPSRPIYWTEPPLGGARTLASYGVDVDERRSRRDIRDDALDAIPQAHRDWIAALPRYHETDDQIFVHAGLRPGVALEDQVEDDLVWIRGPFLDFEGDWGRLVVHGHTALDQPQLYPNRLNLDGGAGYGRALRPALLLGGEVFLLGPEGRSRL